MVSLQQCKATRRKQVTVEERNDRHNLLLEKKKKKLYIWESRKGKKKNLRVRVDEIINQWDCPWLKEFSFTKGMCYLYHVTQQILVNIIFTCPLAFLFAISLSRILNSEIDLKYRNEEQCLQEINREYNTSNNII